MDEKKLNHFKIINKNPDNKDNSSILVGGGCYCWDRYYDAPVCTDGENDVICSGERYRGCNLYDCADSTSNPDDQCCWGHLPGPSDNIDHYMCRKWDAPWGSVCPWGLDIFDGEECVYE